MGDQVLQRIEILIADRPLTPPPEGHARGTTRLQSLQKSGNEFS